MRHKLNKVYLRVEGTAGVKAPVQERAWHI